MALRNFRWRSARIPALRGMLHGARQGGDSFVFLFHFQGLPTIQPFHVACPFIAETSRSNKTLRRRLRLNAGDWSVGCTKFLHSGVPRFRQPGSMRKTPMHVKFFFSPRARFEPIRFSHTFAANRVCGRVPVSFPGHPRPSPEFSLPLQRRCGALRRTMRREPMCVRIRIRMPHSKETSCKTSSDACGFTLRLRFPLRSCSTNPIRRRFPALRPSGTPSIERKNPRMGRRRNAQANGLRSAPTRPMESTGPRDSHCGELRRRACVGNDSRFICARPCGLHGR